MTSAAAESGLNRSVDFMAERYLALVAKLAERDAQLERVRELCDELGRNRGGWVAAVADRFRAALDGAE